MKATINAIALRSFTRSLTCLSKFGDDLTLHATRSTGLSLSTTNTAKSAYAKFDFPPEFFSKWNVELVAQPEGGGGGGDDGNVFGTENVREVPIVAQVLVKSLLSILRHRGVESAVERCELSIVDGPPEGEGGEGSSDGEEERDTLESILVVRLHCRHGVVKTHKLLLLAGTIFQVTRPPPSASSRQSELLVGPRVFKDMLEHFSISKGPKSDPSLVWNFGNVDVVVKTREAVVGTTKLSTELTLGGDDFDVYNIRSPPTSLAFHLREFEATVAFAESSSLPVDMKFTEARQPIFIELESKDFSCLFVIATSPGTPITDAERDENGGKGKRKSTAEMGSESQRVVKRVAASPSARPTIPRVASQSQQQPVRNDQPLFLPASQRTAREEEMMRESGWDAGDVEALGAEFMAMLDDVDDMAWMDGEEPLAPPPPPDAHGGGQQDQTIEADDGGPASQQDVFFEPTPEDQHRQKEFMPLFDD